MRAPHTQSVGGNGQHTNAERHAQPGREGKSACANITGFGANGPPRHNTLGTWHHANCGVSVDTNQEMEDVVAPRYEQTVRSIVESRTSQRLRA